MITASFLLLYALVGIALWQILILRKNIFGESALKNITFDIPHASHLFKSNQLDSLIDYCKNIEQHAPNDDHLHWYLGLAYFRKGDYVNAKKAFQEAVQINPNVEKESKAYLAEIQKSERASMSSAKKRH